VYLEPTPWLADPGTIEDAEQREMALDLQARLAAWMQDFDPAHPIVIATVGSEVPDIAESLRTVGLFDRFFRIPAPSMEAYGREFVERVGPSLCAPSIVNALGKVGLLYSGHFETERRRALALMRLRRLVEREHRPLELVDLVNLTLQGFAEEESHAPTSGEVRRQVAYHEAGHAVVAMVDSKGENIPEFVTVVPCGAFDGLVVPSLAYMLTYRKRETYVQMRHDVRVSLAGRAAEELVLGAEHVSNGATQDLQNAVLHAGAAFAFWGFAPDMDKPGRAGSNLMIIGIDDDEFSPSEQQHLESQVRAFLASEYEVVKEILVANRRMLDAIAKRLLEDAVLDYDALCEISLAHVPVIPPSQRTPGRPHER
jgi:cell division protease FtsH